MFIVNKQLHSAPPSLATVTLSPNHNIDVICDFEHLTVVILEVKNNVESIIKKTSLRQRDALQTLISFPNNLKLPDLNLTVSFAALSEAALSIPKASKNWNIHISYQGFVEETWRDGWSFESIGNQFSTLLPPGSDLKWEISTTPSTKLTQEYLLSIQPWEAAIRSLLHSLQIKTKNKELSQIQVENLSIKEAFYLYLIRLLYSEMNIDTHTSLTNSAIPRSWKSFLSSINSPLKSDSPAGINIKDIMAPTSEALMIVLAEEINKKSRIFEIRDLYKGGYSDNDSIKR